MIRYETEEEFDRDRSNALKQAIEASEDDVAHWLKHGKPYGPEYIKDLQCSDAQAANVAESSSPMPGLSPKQEPEVIQIRLDQVFKDITVAMEAIDSRLKAMEDELSQILQIQNKLLEALAEDQDPDEMPATYMDGTPV